MYRKTTILNLLGLAQVSTWSLARDTGSGASKYWVDTRKYAKKSQVGFGAPSVADPVVAQFGEPMSMPQHTTSEMRPLLTHLLIAMRRRATKWWPTISTPSLTTASRCASRRSDEAAAVASATAVSAASSAAATALAAAAVAAHPRSDSRSDGWQLRQLADHLWLLPDSPTTDSRSI